MVKTIYFNDRCAYWSKIYMFNKAFILNQIGFIYRTMQIQGYIYLDHIYDLFGAAWDPNEPNDVLIFGENEPVISYKHLDGGDFKISILY